MKFSKPLMVLAIVVLMFLAMSTANAKIKFTPGVKAMFNMAKMSGDATTDVDVSSRNGFAFGAFAKFSLSDIIYVQPELLYSMKGAKKSYTSEGSSLNEEAKLSYLDIPILIKLRIPTKGNLQPWFFIGPVLSLNLSAKSSGDWTYTEPLMGKISIANADGTWDGDIPNAKSTDLGAVFGAGVTFPVGKLFLDFGFQYSMGFSSAFEDYDGAETETEIPYVDENGKGEDLKNRVISFSLGVVLPIN